MSNSNRNSSGSSLARQWKLGSANSGIFFIGWFPEEILIGNSRVGIVSSFSASCSSGILSSLSMFLLFPTSASLRCCSTLYGSHSSWITTHPKSWYSTWGFATLPWSSMCSRLSSNGCSVSDSLDTDSLDNSKWGRDYWILVCWEQASRYDIGLDPNDSPALAIIWLMNVSLPSYRRSLLHPCWPAWLVFLAALVGFIHWSLEKKNNKINKYSNVILLLGSWWEATHHKARDECASSYLSSYHADPSRMRGKSSNHTLPNWCNYYWCWSYFCALIAFPDNDAKMFSVPNTWNCTKKTKDINYQPMVRLLFQGYCARSMQDTCSLPNINYLLECMQYIINSSHTYRIHKQCYSIDDLWNYWTMTETATTIIN